MIYFDEDNPLDDEWELPDLYANLRKRKAFALPHHTAYLREQRGKDWSIFDPQLSPVMEIYSVHGSSEAVDSPIPLTQNHPMGPRCTQGTFVAALNAGHRVGVIASNDGCGLPGCWDLGIAGIWAEELTRDALWNAIRQRRTFGLTGDRMALMFTINGEMMGSELPHTREANAEVAVTCAQPLDRIELIHNGIVAETYCHRGAWERRDCGKGRYKVLLECGCGPHKGFGFQDVLQHWSGTVDLRGGRLLGIEPRFTMFGQRFRIEGETRATFVMRTTSESETKAIQGLVLEIEGTPETAVAVQVDGHVLEKRLRDLHQANTLLPLLDESIQRIERQFGVKPGDRENPDVFYHNARKIRLSPAWPEAAWRVTATFADLPVAGGDNYYYVRATQIDRQTAWSSPIWIAAQT